MFLRTRPSKKEKVLHQLQNADVPFTLPNAECIQLSNQTKVDELLSIDEDVIIQDYNSQRTLDLFKSFKLQTSNSKLSVWDCCAASGGKSILFHDYFPQAHLTVSDVRESILINLQKRLKRAGIKNYDYFVADISSPRFSLKNKFDLVICDAPCSGSGTWSRTPEQLYFFKEEKIMAYGNLQKKILSRVIPSIRANGFLLYITCSVFAEENERISEYIIEQHSLKLIRSELIRGYNEKADTLYAALFTN